MAGALGSNAAALLCALLVSAAGGLTLLIFFRRGLNAPAEARRDAI
jgi:hypothetical protein